MFFRFLGRFVFIFYIVPATVDTLRFVRKHAEPQVAAMVKAGIQKMTEDILDLTKDTTIPSRT